MSALATFSSIIPAEININFVIHNENAMRNIRWRRFLADLHSIEGNSQTIEDLIERETESALHFIEEQYQDIKKHYVPPDIEPVKRRKVVMSTGALDDLERLSREGPPDD